MILLSDGQSKLEIDLASWDGDAYVSVSVDSRGYAGANDLHVFSEEFKSFCKGLVNLQKNLKGKVELKSISPDEMDITIQPFDALGHISVKGKLGYHIYTKHSSNWHSVEFGFEVDPQELDKIIKVDWVQKYAT